MSLLRAPRGTNDILPQEQPYWDLVRGAAERLCQVYGYQRIDTPIFEDAAVFLRTAGEGTDIVEKEMYIFEDRGGNRLALRPEGTASVCRAYLEHGMHSLPQPVRLYYFTPIFRYDRPQAGRYRQHHQFGIEAIGEADPLVDAEVIQVLHRLYTELGLRDITLFLNSIGDQVCRPAYIEELKAYYADKLDKVCPDCVVRYEKNPLRLLDCKNERCQPIISGAPTIIERLCAACAEHFARLRRYLELSSIDYVINPRLVRGLDYYTRTVFEFQPRIEGAQSTIGAGGRYDGLIEQLGGRPTPGIGFGTGIERLVLNLKRQEVAVPLAQRPLAYVAYPVEDARDAAFMLTSHLRENGINAQMAVGSRSLKAQMRQADAAGARYAAIIGREEMAKGAVLLRRLSDGTQIEVPQGEVIEHLTEDMLEI